jgi:hypothetical protein
MHQVLAPAIVGHSIRAADNPDAEIATPLQSHHECVARNLPPVQNAPAVTSETCHQNSNLPQSAALHSIRNARRLHGKQQQVAGSVQRPGIR